MDKEKQKTINQLLNVPIPRPPKYESNLVKRCFDLANKNLAFFSPEDLRIMIGQNIGLEYLIPIALDILEEEPFMEAEYYEGDLFLSLLKADSSYWDEHCKQKEHMSEIFRDNTEAFKKLDLDTQEDIYNAYNKF